MPTAQRLLLGDQRLGPVAKEDHPAAVAQHRVRPVRGQPATAVTPFQLVEMSGQIDGPAHMGDQFIEPGGVLDPVGPLSAGALHQQLDGVFIGLVDGTADTVVDIQLARPVVIELGLVKTTLTAGKIQVGGVQAAGGLLLQFRSPGAGVDEMIHVVLVGAVVDIDFGAGAHRLRRLVEHQQAGRPGLADGDQLLKKVPPEQLIRGCGVKRIQKRLMARPGVRKPARTFHETPNVFLSPATNYVTKQSAPASPPRQRNDWTTDRKMPTPRITLPSRVETFS